MLTVQTFTNYFTWSLIKLVDKPNLNIELRRWLTLICVCLLVSCEDDPNIHPTDIVIPETVQPYVERFLWEAELRGKNLDISNLSIAFERNINTPLGDSLGTVVGACTRTRNLHLVKLDTLNSLWQLSGNLGREEIVFHELGHCLLDRPHRDDKFISGDFASIMRSVGLLQYSDLSRYTGLFLQPNVNKVHRRDYYIDELFNENVPPPCWADTNAVPNFPVEEFDQDFVVNREYFRSWVDPDNNLWLFGREKNFRYRPGIGFDTALPGITITSMSNTNDNRLWLSGIQDEKNIIATFNQEQLTTRFLHEELPEAFLAIDRILVDDLHRIWISDRGGNLFMNSGDGFRKIEIPSQIRISSIRKAPNDKIYLLKEGRFYIIEDETTVVEMGRENSDLPTSLFRRLEVDGQGTAWLQPAESSAYIVKLTRELQVSSLQLDQVNLTEIRINDISCDALGNIWVATSNGIRKWQDNAFSKYCTYNNGLKILNFSSLQAGSDGIVWATGRKESNGQTKLLMMQPDS